MHFMHPDSEDLVESIWVFRGFFNWLHSLATLRVPQALAVLSSPFLANPRRMMKSSAPSFGGGFPQRLPVLSMVDGSSLLSKGCARGVVTGQLGWWNSWGEVGLNLATLKYVLGTLLGQAISIGLNHVGRLRCFCDWYGPSTYSPLLSCSR